MEEATRESLRGARNVAFGLMGLLFLALLASMGPRFEVPALLFGAAGLTVLILSCLTREPGMQRWLFLLAGGAGAAVMITLVVFRLLAWAGHTPGGDGGGLTVPVLIGGPLVFLASGLGLLVRLIWRSCRRRGRGDRA